MTYQIQPNRWYPNHNNLPQGSIQKMQMSQFWGVCQIQKLTFARFTWIYWGWRFEKYFENSGNRGGTLYAWVRLVVWLVVPEGFFAENRLWGKFV